MLTNERGKTLEVDWERVWFTAGMIAAIAAAIGGVADAAKSVVELANKIKGMRAEKKDQGVPEDDDEYMNREEAVEWLESVLKTLKEEKALEDETNDTEEEAEEDEEDS